MADLRLALRNVYGDLLGERVSILLRHRQSSERLLVKDQSSGTRIRVTGLQGPPKGLYTIEVDPHSYCPVGHFINLRSDDVTDHEMVFPIDIDKVDGVDFPDYAALDSQVQGLFGRSSEVVGFEGLKGKALYEAVDDLRRAGFLNIATKSAATVLSGGTTVFSHVNSLLKLRGDRFFAQVSPTLREETKNSVSEGLFEPVSGALHHGPPGFEDAGSFKTRDRYGNLQITFFKNESNEFVADIDIDDANGLEHIFQLLRNWIGRRDTHPYEIQQILIVHQKLDPGYRLLV